MDSKDELKHRAQENTLVGLSLLQKHGTLPESPQELMSSMPACRFSITSVNQFAFSKRPQIVLNTNAYQVSGLFFSRTRTAMLIKQRSWVSLWFVNTIPRRQESLSSKGCSKSLRRSARALGTPSFLTAISTQARLSRLGRFPLRTSPRSTLLYVICKSRNHLTVLLFRADILFTTGLVKTMLEIRRLWQAEVDFPPSKTIFLPGVSGLLHSCSEGRSITLVLIGPHAPCSGDQETATCADDRTAYKHQPRDRKCCRKRDRHKVSCESRASFHQACGGLLYYVAWGIRLGQGH
jgi:hypothetical protein